jgi:hypothetical protein
MQAQVLGASSSGPGQTAMDGQRGNGLERVRRRSREKLARALSRDQESVAGQNVCRI